MGGVGTHDEVLKERVAPLEIDVRAAGEVRGLLQEDGLGPV